MKLTELALRCLPVCGSWARVDVWTSDWCALQQASHKSDGSDSDGSDDSEDDDSEVEAIRAQNGAHRQTSSPYMFPDWVVILHQL
jgi:hypothetical protein